MKTNTHTNYFLGFSLACALFFTGTSESKASVNTNDVDVSTNDRTSAFFVNGGKVRSTDGLNTIITITGDGKADLVTFKTTSKASDKYIYLITDANGNILTTERSNHDFEGASIGICRVYGLSFTGALRISGKNVKDSKLSTGKSSISSNSITIDRRGKGAVFGGKLSGGPFSFCVDGTPDKVSGIRLAGNVGKKSGYIITDDKGKILGLPPTLKAVRGVNFDEAGEGTCFIYHIAYNNVRSLEAGKRIKDLKGKFDLSNRIRVDRAKPKGGRIIGGPYNFVVDGKADRLKGISVKGKSGSKFSWIITDNKGKILGLPPTLKAVRGVNFDEAGVGTCLVWHISYESGIVNLKEGKNVNKLSGCFGLSKSVKVVRKAMSRGRKNVNETNVFTEALTDVKLFPQPASSVLTAELATENSTSTIMVRINDIVGHEVSSMRFQKNEAIKMDVSNLREGMYLMTLQNEDTGYRMTKQIMIKN